MKCIAVRFVGHHSAESLRSAGANRVVDSMADVSTAEVEQMLNG
jgi:beta-phosphoglucomutase